MTIISLNSFNESKYFVLNLRGCVINLPIVPIFKQKKSGVTDVYKQQQQMSKSSFGICQFPASVSFRRRSVFGVGQFSASVSFRRRSVYDALTSKCERLI